jgi:hypothetical protein
MSGPVKPIGHCCDEMQRRLAEGEVAITYWDHFREYGIRVLDGGTSSVTIDYCPWCGTRLPSQLRDQWFEVVEALGLEPDAPGLPSELRSGEWWRKRSL